MRAKWSAARLEKAMLEVLGTCEIILTERAIRVNGKPCAAKIVWDRGPPLITIDAYSFGRVKAVMHELLHYVLREEMVRYNETVEEIVIEGLTEYMLNGVVAKNTKRWKMWTKAIAGRVK